MSKGNAALQQAVTLIQRLVKARNELAREVKFTEEQKNDVLGIFGAPGLRRMQPVRGKALPRRRGKAGESPDSPGTGVWLERRKALEKGKLNLALADAEKAIALSPSHWVGYYVRGRVRLERGNSDALADLTRAAQLTDRKDADVLHVLADALYRSGNLEEAIIVQHGPSS